MSAGEEGAEAAEGDATALTDVELFKLYKKYLNLLFFYQ